MAKKNCIEILKNSLPDLHKFLEEKNGVYDGSDKAKQAYIKAARELQEQSLNTINDVYAQLGVEGFKKDGAKEVTFKGEISDLETEGQKTTQAPSQPKADVPIEGKSDAEIEKRMGELEDNKEYGNEFTTLEKEMEKRERNTVFNVPLVEVGKAVDALMDKEKNQPNGYGAFIEKRDARETKEIAEKYLNPTEILDSDLKKDFKEAVMGNPDTWYADGLKLRESLKESSNRGIDTKKMVAEVEKEFIKDGYTSEDAKAFVARQLKPIFEGSQKVETDKGKLISQPIEGKKPDVVDKKVETKKSEPTEPKAEEKPIPAFHKKVDDVADSLIKALSAKLPPGTKKQGAGDIATIIRAAADIIKKAHDIGGNIKKAIDEAVAYVKKQFKDNNLGDVDENIIREHFENQEITGETPPPKPPVDNVTEEGDAENRLTAKFKAWTPITKDKTIVQDVKETHEKRKKQDLFDENYEREQRDKAATDLSIDLLVQEARTELQDGYLDYLVDLVQTGDLLESTQHGIIQSLMWRQGLANDIINNLSVLDKTLATKASDNMMMRRAMGGKDDISDTQEEMIESAIGEEGSTLKTMQENLESARRDNTIPEEIQEEVSQVTTQEIEQEIKEEQEEIVPPKPKQSGSKTKKIDTSKFQAKAELIKTELSKKTGDNFLSTLIDNINKIAAVC